MVFSRDDFIEFAKKPEKPVLDSKKQAERSKNQTDSPVNYSPRDNQFDDPGARTAHTEHKSTVTPVMVNRLILDLAHLETSVSLIVRVYYKRCPIA